MPRVHGKTLKVVHSGDEVFAQPAEVCLVVLARRLDKMLAAQVIQSRRLQGACSKGALVSVLRTLPQPMDCVCPPIVTTPSP